MNSKFVFEGTKANLYNYLTKELKINEHRPKSHKCLGRYQLTPLKEQIEKIYSTVEKSGKIYFSEDYEIKHPHDKNTKLNIIDETSIAFDVCTVFVKIID